MSNGLEHERRSTDRRTILKAVTVGAVRSIVAAPSRAQTPARTYVLVQGAWFGGWVWKPVAQRLREMGHTVLAPSLTGLGDRKHLLRSGINLDTHTDDIVNLIEMEDLSQVVLVGWSYGGMVTINVLARIPQRIGSIVYLEHTGPYTAVHRIEHRRFCVRARISESGRLRAGFGPFEQRRRASPFPAAPKASDLDFLPHGQFEISTSKRLSSVQAFSETRSAYYAVC